MKHIVLTTDLSPASLAAFEPVGDLAAKLGAKLSIVHIMPEQTALPYGYPYVPPANPDQIEAYRREAEQSLERARATLPSGVESVSVLVETSERVDRAVCDWAIAHDADAIAMATHGYSGFRRLLLGSISENVLRASTLPVFLFPVSED